MIMNNELINMNIMSKSKVIKIAIVEDDFYYKKMLKKYLENHFHKVQNLNLELEITAYSSAQDFLENLEKDIDIIFLDYYLENDFGEIPFTGQDLLQTIKDFCNDCKVIIISAQDSIDTTIELFKEGIYEYIVKDVDSLLRITSVVDEIVAVTFLKSDKAK